MDHRTLLVESPRSQECHRRIATIISSQSRDSCSDSIKINAHLILDISLIFENLHAKHSLTNRSDIIAWIISRLEAWRLLDDSEKTTESLVSLLCPVHEPILRTTTPPPQQLCSRKEIGSGSGIHSDSDKENTPVLNRRRSSADKKSLNPKTLTINRIMESTEHDLSANAILSTAGSRRPLTPLTSSKNSRLKGHRSREGRISSFDKGDGPNRTPMTPCLAEPSGEHFVPLSKSKGPRLRRRVT